MTVNIDLLKLAADAIYPSTGTIGAVTLLSGNLASNAAVTVTPASDEITFSSDHGLVTGSRIRLGGTTLPTGLIGTTDYYSIAISPQVIKIAANQADAIAGTPINLTDTGTAVIVNEQNLSVTDRIEVLLNKEVTHPALTGGRFPLSNVGLAVELSGVARKPTKQFTVDNASTTALEYKHYLILYGSSVSTSFGSTTGITGWILDTVPTLQSIEVGETRILALKLETSN